jgi:light-regulated signal transduction histidine kinase (bacteriophytochrome)
VVNLIDAECQWFKAEIRHHGPGGSQQCGTPGNLAGQSGANAVKYTSRNGRINIDCKADASAVLIEIADTGIGIPAHQVNEMFGAFRQGNAQTEGLGLGLWIVRQNTEAIGVKVDVKSVEGEGTRFNIKVLQHIGEAVTKVSATTKREGCHHGVS